MKALLLSLIALSVLTAGCGDDKKAPTRGTVRGRGATTGLADGTTIPGDNPGGTNPNTGTMGNVTGFTLQSVKSFVSATMDPETEMRAPIHFIGLEGDILLVGGANVRTIGSGTAQIANGSRAAFQIVDDIAYNKEDNAIVIGFQQGQNGYSVSGSISNNGMVNMTFSDQWGSVNFVGQYSYNNPTTSTFNGNVYFTNLSGLNPNQRIHLGQFSIPTCSFFRCQ